MIDDGEPLEPAASNRPRLTGRALAPVAHSLTRMETAGIIVLWVLALMRVTRLINADELTDPIRIWVMRKTGPESRWSYFVQCPWCVSMWLGFATAAFPIWLTGVSWWWLPLLALAGSQITGLLAQLDDPDAEIVIEQ